MGLRATQGDEKRLLFSNYSHWKDRPPLCHLDRSVAQRRDLCVDTPSWKCFSHLTTSHALEYLSHKMIREEPGDLIQGTLEMLILKALARGPLHGYAVAEWIEQTSQQVLKVEEGALYPALHRLQLRGLLQAEWGASENNRRAKFYQLTADGKKQMNAESQRWARLSAAVAFVMQAS